MNTNELVQEIVRNLRDGNDVAAFDNAELAKKIDNDNQFDDCFKKTYEELLLSEPDIAKKFSNICTKHLTDKEEKSNNLDDDESLRSSKSNEKGPKDKMSKKKKIYIILGVIVVLILISSFAGDSNEEYTASSSFTTEGTPAKEAVTETRGAINTEINGEYIIGLSPSEYSTGEEKEFETAQSGNYVAGVDFPAGVYDIIPISGGGNVIGTNLNVIMGTDNDDFYTGYYDNHYFEDGDSLEVSGVSVKLVPQHDDEFVIPAGVYNITATYGGGNVIGSGLNEIMGTANDDFYVKEFENASLEESEYFSTTGVQLQLDPKEKEVVVQEAVDAIPGEEIQETLDYTINSDGTVTEKCMQDYSETNCDNLHTIDELREEIDKQLSEEE